MGVTSDSEHHSRQTQFSITITVSTLNRSLAPKKIDYVINIKTLWNWRGMEHYKATKVSGHCQIQKLSYSIVKQQTLFDKNKTISNLFL